MDMTPEQISPLSLLGVTTLAAQEHAAQDAQQVACSGHSNTTTSVSMASRSGFLDATALLFSACGELRLGQMVAVPNFTLMDSMAAVKIMDARMDSGMELPASELPESDRLDNLSMIRTIDEFDPFQPLTVADVLWIIDRLLACEAAWHQGSALSQTLYTCLYFHAINSLSHKHPRFQQPYEPACGQASSKDTVAHKSTAHLPHLQLVYKVLRAFILATAKTIDIAWSELTSKQHLHDGEDFSSDKNGLSLLETTDTGYVIAELDDALAWIQSQPDFLPKHHTDSLNARLNFRKQMLYAVRLLQSPAEAAPLDVIMHTKFARRDWSLLRPAPTIPPTTDSAPTRASPGPNSSNANVSKVVPLQPPNRNAAPSAASVSAFDPAYNRRLAWCQALRPISLPSPTDTWHILDGILEDLQSVVQALQHPGFVSWKTFFTHRAINFQNLQPMSSTPYVRSLLQTAVCDRNMVAGRLPLEWLTETFFQEVALVDPLLIRRASRIGRNNVEGGIRTMWNAPPPLGQRVHYFVHRVAGQLVQYLTTLSQNRARCKRTLASRLYREWVHISEEASEIGHQLEATLATSERYIPDSLFAATQHMALEIMTQITFSGFELELYGGDSDCESMWWLASRIQGEQTMVCSELRDELSKALEPSPPEQRPRKSHATILYLSRQIHLAQALEQLVISTIFLKRLSERRGKCDTARQQPCFKSLTPEEDWSQLDLAKAIFNSRIKWTHAIAPGRNGPSGETKEDDINETLWQEYLSFQAELDATDDSTLSLVAKDRLDQAIMLLKQLTCTFAGEQKQELGAPDFSEFVSSLLKTAAHNRDTLDMILTHRRTVLTESSSDPTASISAPVAGRGYGEWVFEHPWIPKWAPPESKTGIIPEA